MSSTAPTSDSQLVAGLSGEWTIRRPGRAERRWFLRHGMLRGLFWCIPFVIGALMWVFWFEVTLRDQVPSTLLILGGLTLLLYSVWGLLYPRRWLVAIGEREVMVERGLLFSTRVFISYDRVQQVDITTTPMMAELDLTELVLQTASGGVRIYALDPDDAAYITDRVRIDQPPAPTMSR